MAVGFMATPAAASDGVSGAVQDFFEWSVNAQRETGDAFWRAIYGDSWNPDGGFSNGVGVDRVELVEKYGAYTDTMETELGSTTLVDGSAVRLHFVSTHCGWIGGSALENTNLSTGVTVEGRWIAKQSSVWVNPFNTNINGAEGGYEPMSAPFSGSYVYGSEFVATGSPRVLTYYNTSIGKDWFEAATTVRNIAADSSLKPLSMYFLWSGVSGEYVGVRCTQYVDLTPDGGIGSAATVDISEPSRAGSIAGDVYVVNENGEETVYNDYSVVNETTNIYNDPFSGTERPMEDWAYDYIERQYNITLEDGANVTIKYGDENIEIVEGDSIETLNYGSGSSGEGGGEGDGGGSGIGDAIANLFTVLGEIILGLITALINLATRALDAFKGLFDLFGQLVETIAGFFGGFTDFLAGVFPFLPEETFTIFNFGLILLVAATVFRKFLK